MTCTVDGLPLNVRLLVIDDDDVDRERVLRMLARTPLTVDAKQADSSSSALKLLRQYDFDCIVLDNQLGDANGAELLPTIQRESRRPCPVIMITGAGNETLAVRALQDGAADYLTKYQLNADLLLRAIRRALEHQRMATELEELRKGLEQRVEQQAAAIRQSERDLRAILDHTPTVIGYWSADLRNRFGNRAYRRWLGVDPETLPGRTLPEVIGAARWARHRHHVEGVLRGESQWFEEADLAPDGRTHRHAQLSFHPDIGDDGRVRGFYSTINDVTAIKQAQARAEELAAFTETLFEHSPVGLGVFDDHWRCIKCNRALAELIGAAPLALEGEALDTMSLDDLLPLKALGLATFADGHPRRLGVDLRTPFGRRLLASCAWARVEREGRAQLLLAVQDGTEQQQAHDALVAARDAAERATRSKSGFLANMSHEIRTPMNAIIGLSRLALDDALPEPSRRFVEKAHGAAMSLLGLLDDVLDYSKIEAGQLRFEHLPLDVEQVVQRVVDLFAARIEERGLGFVVDLAPDLPRWVMGDPLRLGQVLNNLVGNAVKFTESGAIVITVAPMPGDEPAPGMLRFAVRDSGIGIPEGQRDVLFEAFEQGDSSITRRFGGTGLGLTISRRLVAAMHGTIGVDSSAGAGSEFWFSARLPPAPAPPEQPLPAMVVPLRVLLCEPDDRVAAALLRMLQRWRVGVQRVADMASAQQAVADAAAQDRAVHTVLLSCPVGAPPDGNAARALRQAAGAGSAPSVICMVSTVAHAHGPDDGDRAGCDRVLGRPVMPAPLQAALWPAQGAEATPRDPPDAVASRASLAAEGRVLHGLQVLVVEDNETNRLVARLTLERFGAEVSEAENGLEALARLEAVPPGTFRLVLMDVHMPGMDGLEATRRIRMRPDLRELPVIGMTAAAMPEDRLNCLQAGMVDHVSKPIRVEELLDVLLHWSGRRPRRPA